MTKFPISWLVWSRQYLKSQI